MTGCFNRLLNLRETKIDDRSGPNQTHIMKYLSHLSVATAAAFSLVFFAAPRAGAETAAKETRLGPFSAQKVAIAKHVGGARQRHSDNPNEPPTIAIVLIVEQKMTGNQQEITARISAHREGPGGTAGWCRRHARARHSAGRVRNAASESGRSAHHPDVFCARRQIQNRRRRREHQLVAIHGREDDPNHSRELETPPFVQRANRSLSATIRLSF